MSVKDTVQANKAMVTRFIDAMCRGDGEALAAFYTADGTVWTSGSTLISGTRHASEVAEFAGGVLQAFPDGLEFVVTGMTAEGDRVAVECYSKGRHVTGIDYRNQYHFLFECRDGKVAALREYMDTELVTAVLCGGQKPPS